jgi:23S rRNA (uracil1939-C5)-methyltransferase
MRKNTVFEGECFDLSRQGYGICRQEGQVVFVPDLLPGEKADIVIVHAGKSHSIGKVKRRITTSKERTAPACPHASSCGGCMLQHTNGQEKWKQKWMEQLFAPRKLQPILYGQPFQYRNKAQFPVQVKDGKVQAGFYKPHSHDIVPISSCAIQHSEINEMLEFILNHLSAEEAALLRHILIRVSKEESLVVFIGKENRFERMAALLASHFPKLAGVIFNENRRDDNVILGEDYEVLYGRDWMKEDCLGLDIRLHFKSFYQVNHEMMEVLYRRALELAQIKPGDTVIDFYSGTGTIGLLAAREGAHVIGVEIVPEAVADAKANQKANGLDNAEFRCQDASEFAREYKGRTDVLFVDPPRKGLSQQGLEDIVRIGPNRILYISCNPETLKRDVQRFEQMGYEADVLQPADLFAQTPRLEMICRLVKKDLHEV